MNKNIINLIPIFQSPDNIFDLRSSIWYPLLRVYFNDVSDCVYSLCMSFWMAKLILLIFPDSTKCNHFPLFFILQNRLWEAHNVILWTHVTLSVLCTLVTHGYMPWLPTNVFEDFILLMFVNIPHQKLVAYFPLRDYGIIEDIKEIIGILSK